MSQPITVRRYYIVPDEIASPLGDGYPEWRREDVEDEARRRGCLVAVEDSCGYGWTERRRYDPREGSA